MTALKHILSFIVGSYGIFGGNAKLLYELSMCGVVFFVFLPLLIIPPDGVALISICKFDCLLVYSRGSYGTPKFLP